MGNCISGVSFKGYSLIETQDTCLYEPSRNGHFFTLKARRLFKICIIGIQNGPVPLRVEPVEVMENPGQAGPLLVRLLEDAALVDRREHSVGHLEEECLVNLAISRNS